MKQLCRQLRKQHRIRLHVNLFMSLIFKELLESLWAMLVTYDKVTSKDVFEARLIQNRVSMEFMVTWFCFHLSDNYLV